MINNHLRATIVIVLVLFCLIQCKNQSQNSHASENGFKQNIDEPTHKNLDDSLKKAQNFDCFEDDFFNNLNTLGYEVDSVVQKKITTQYIQNVSFRITRSSYKKQPDFVKNIKLSNLYYISKIDSLTSEYLKKAEVFRGTLCLYQWSFNDSLVVIDAFKKFDYLLNNDLQPCSKSYYDINCSSIWFLMDKSGKGSPQYEEVSTLMKNSPNLR